MLERLYRTGLKTLSTFGRAKAPLSSGRPARTLMDCRPPTCSMVAGVSSWHASRRQHTLGACRVCRWAQAFGSLLSVLHAVRYLVLMGLIKQVLLHSMWYLPVTNQ